MYASGQMVSFSFDICSNKMTDNMFTVSTPFVKETSAITFTNLHYREKPYAKKT